MKKKDLYCIEQYRPRIDANPNVLSVRAAFYSAAASLGLYSRISSKYILPEPPGIAVLP